MTQILSPNELDRARVIIHAEQIAAATTKIMEALHAASDPRAGVRLHLPATLPRTAMTQLVQDFRSKDWDGQVTQEAHEDQRDGSIPQEVLVAPAARTP